MKKIKIKHQFLKGFTLIELIVVIAIITVLAGTLVPPILGYVRKAAKKADVANARRVYEDAQLLLMTSDEARNSFYKYNTTKFDVKVNAGKENAESYKLVVVCKVDGRPSGNPKYPVWGIGNREAQKFCDIMNKETAVGTDKYLVPIKYHKETTAGYEANRWIICYRDGDQSAVEIWVADGTKTYGCLPLYRLFPDPDSEYA